MQRLIEAAKTEEESKKAFITKSVKRNISELNKYSKGQKGLRDFIESLNDDVEWLSIDIPTQDIDHRISTRTNLDITQTIELNQDYNNKLDRYVRHTGTSRSSAIRLCIVKELYNRRSVLNESNSDKIESTWLEVRKQLMMSNQMLVDILSYHLEHKSIESKLSIIELKNLRYIRDAYRKIKDTSAYDVIEDHRDGDYIIEILNEIESFVDAKA